MMSRTPEIVYDAAMGQAATLAQLEELKAKLLRGQITCAALRLYRVDGTWEDVVIGGNEAERTEALDNLRRSFEQAS